MPWLRIEMSVVVRVMLVRVLQQKQIINIFMTLYQMTMENSVTK